MNPTSVLNKQFVRKKNKGMKNHNSQNNQCLIFWKISTSECAFECALKESKNMFMDLLVTTFAHLPAAFYFFSLNVECFCCSKLIFFFILYSLNCHRFTDYATRLVNKAKVTCYILFARQFSIILSSKVVKFTMRFINICFSLHVFTKSV